MHDTTDLYVMYGSDVVEHTLDDVFMTDDLRRARKRELEMLQREVSMLGDVFKTPLKIFDIGVGDGHVPLSLKKELLSSVKSYVGIDNSAREIKQCKINIENNGLKNVVRVFKLDATSLGDKNFQQQFLSPFHVVVCTYFTPGNFKPDEIRIDEDSSGYIVRYRDEVLNPNKKFQKIFSEAYRLLVPGGKLILGSTYIDSEATRLKQEAFYKKCGMHVITGAKDTFTATREGFWSERFTDEKLYVYLNFIPRKEIAFVPLDRENFARAIIITKTI